MIDALKPYPAMKDSGVAWLGDVPEHWKMRRLRNTVDMRVSNVDKHTKDGELPVRLCNYVDVYKNDRITDRLSFMKATASPSEMDRFRLHLGDVLITKDSEGWKDIGVPALVEHVADDLLCGYHLALLRPLKCIDGRFLLRALQSKSVSYQFHVEANGVTRYGLSHAAIKSIWVPIAPLPEQAAIARFLDHADARIRRYIRAKLKLIKLLGEQKQAIVYTTITSGLNVNCRKQSLGSSPDFSVNAAWKISRLWEVSDFRSEKNHPELPLLSVFLGRGVIPYGEGGGQVHKPSLSLAGYQVVHQGDLVLNNQQAWRGSVGVSAYNGIISPAYVVLALNEIFDPGFADYLFKSRIMVAQFVTASKGVGDIQRDIHTPWLRNVRVPIPELNEQKKISEHLDKELVEIETQMSLLNREIELVREYRGRLIDDVVTGKLDIRQAAATLPDEVFEFEPLDEIEDVPQDESVAEDVELEAADVA